jgi:hypothetical protein
MKQEQTYERLLETRSEIQAQIESHARTDSFGELIPARVQRLRMEGKI